MGAPNPNFYKGQIYICGNCFGEANKGIYRRNVPSGETTAHDFTGHQFGERFGQTLCAVDINGDGYHDLVVGAPLHSKDSMVL